MTGDEPPRLVHGRPPRSVRPGDHVPVEDEFDPFAGSRRDYPPTGEGDDGVVTFARPRSGAAPAARRVEPPRSVRPLDHVPVEEEFDPFAGSHRDYPPTGEGDDTLVATRRG